MAQQSVGLVLSLKSRASEYLSGQLMQGNDEPVVASLGLVIKARIRLGIAIAMMGVVVMSDHQQCHEPMGKHG